MAYTLAELAYLAGFVDGEGCFFIGRFETKARPGARTFPNYHTLLKISNNNYPVLEWIQMRFGGSIDKRNRKQKLRQNEVPTYSLEFTGNNLTEITEALLPYLIIKQKHAEVMMKMRSTFPKKRGKRFVTPEEDAIRSACLSEIRTLNTRFHNHPLKLPCALSP